MKKQVRLQIHSAAEEQSLIQTAKGELYEKGSHLYIRYAETDPNMGNTMTTVKVEMRHEAQHPVIKVLRHGDVQSEQTFELQKKLKGFYITPQLRLELAARTHAINNELYEGIGNIEWSYDLYADDQNIGTYQLKLEIQEGQ
jgi:uncharacterized beta-barrel protein YwiB (DUF1934 family)